MALRWTFGQPNTIRIFLHLLLQETRLPLVIVPKPEHHMGMLYQILHSSKTILETTLVMPTAHHPSLEPPSMTRPLCICLLCSRHGYRRRAHLLNNLNVVASHLDASGVGFS